MLCIRIPCWELPRNYRITWDKFELSGKINLIVESIPRISPWIVWLGGKMKRNCLYYFLKIGPKMSFSNDDGRIMAATAGLSRPISFGMPPIHNICIDNTKLRFDLHCTLTRAITLTSVWEPNSAQSRVRLDWWDFFTWFRQKASTNLMTND